ncbi:helix-turn-helix domain-containing protein [Flavobacterium oreochromis]|uniref:Helix-turn-helix domain-containing protein n=1 Tax=Flavobacterium oreochromis TaxID=2906078 RepID=A0ABW8PBW0_9FLAO|nr:helix-turn-helix domain-containing protein [Flavobacterium oreochromis]OWP75188.1 DNA-binding protein [Flavobacterium oreochromis]
MKNENQILEKLNQLENLIVNTSKQILTVDDLVNYSGFSRSYVYKLVHNKLIPFSKPNGKTLFFEKVEVDKFLLKNKSVSISDIKDKAIQYSLNK